ncbi:RNA-directed DNA polymerase, eukaryota, reverse transcriptase zinc-binding domain protein [Tanacetum coccineum]|uniref:RNA-directed DNA polymerase, eukaryota, reverse transcriptase zinc-binding domain protein n=1 Tax=Tanacetum coccineum TaxID=301880 RepID=A0ABQ5DSS9_9ASTR
MKNIDLFSIKRCWGNLAFDYAHSASVGNSGGILCVWDPKSFSKLNATISDYFVMVRGDWIPNGEVVVMGDFNEVRKKDERFGSVYNVHGANAFNLFISNAGLEEVPLGGCLLLVYLSIGGRLTLLKSVIGSMPIYHMSIFKVPMKILQRMESIRSHFFNGSDPLAKKPTWVKWTNVLASKEKGGLGISSLYALNRALMFKWVWRFLSQNSSLWANVIKSIHGDHGKIGKQVKVSYPSIWLDIVKEVDLLKKRGLNLLSFVNKKVGNGSDTLFWEETWHGDVAFKFLFPRAYALESCKNIDVASKLSQNSLAFTFRREPRGGVEQDQFDSLKAMVEGTSLVNIRDRWIWSLQSSGDFTVASIRKLIDEFTLSEVSSSTRWIKAVPIKVNVLAWKIKLDNLPTRLNISRRGMDIDSILCPTCGKAVESTRHIFFTCQIARDILHLITSWWNIPYMEVSSYEECWRRNVLGPRDTPQLLIFTLHYLLIIGYPLVALDWNVITRIASVAILVLEAFLDQSKLLVTSSYAELSLGTWNLLCQLGLMKGLGFYPFDFDTGVNWAR